MCGRFYATRPPAALAVLFNATGPIPNHPPSWNVAPTDSTLVVRRNPENGERHLGTLRWGLVPHWATDAKGAAQRINARSETAAEKPMFRDAFRRRRCLVPVDGFYEWQVTGNGPKPQRQAYAIAPAEDVPMVFAGLWESWRDPAGDVLRTFTILTRAASGPLSRLHARTPVMLPSDAWAGWLGEVEAEPSDLLALPTPELRIWRIGGRVGSVRENDEDLLAPLPDPAITNLRAAPVRHNCYCELCSFTRAQR